MIIKLNKVYKIFSFIFTFLIFVSCNNTINGTVDKNDRIELVPEPDKGERLKYEAIEVLKKSNCFLINPDTSVCGIKIRNFESATTIIGNKNQIDSINQYHFYSKFNREILTLTQHSGDAKNQISIFKVEYSNKINFDYKQLLIDTFKTEKGIKLGMNKKQIIEKLGSCYAALDSTKDYLELYYIIALLKDSKSEVLRQYNMPTYFASYKFWDNKLETFEFGFEYP